VVIKRLSVARGAMTGLKVLGAARRSARAVVLRARGQGAGARRDVGERQSRHTLSRTMRRSRRLDPGKAPAIFRAGSSARWSVATMA